MKKKLIFQGSIPRVPIWIVCNSLFHKPSLLASLSLIDRAVFALFCRLLANKTARRKTRNGGKTLGNISLIFARRLRALAVFVGGLLLFLATGSSEGCFAWFEICERMSECCSGVIPLDVSGVDAADGVVSKLSSFVFTLAGVAVKDDSVDDVLDKDGVDCSVVTVSGVFASTSPLAVSSRSASL